MQVREVGTIKKVFSDKGYAFVQRDGGPDLFLHVSQLRDIAVKVKLEPGVQVEFEVSSTPKGLAAVDVELL